MQQEHFKSTVNRRSFLRASLALSAAAFSPSVLSQEYPTYAQANPSQRRLRMLNVNTREQLDVVYWKDGNYVHDHIGQLNYFMRDHHRNEAAQMHVRLYDSLYLLHSALETDSPISVLSGFRTQATNEMLRGKYTHVAKKSFHIKGRAVDFYIAGINNDKIQKTARDMNLGGVGYYTKAHFVHLDTGYPRHWVMS